MEIAARRECSAREFDILLTELAYDRLFSSLWSLRGERGAGKNGQGSPVFA